MDIPTVRDFKVANIQDASVSVVDYYEPSKCHSFQMDSDCSEVKKEASFMGTGQISVKKKQNLLKLTFFHQTATYFLTNSCVFLYTFLLS